MSAKFKKSFKSKKKNILSAFCKIMEMTRSSQEKKSLRDFNFQIELDLEKFSKEDIHLGI